MIMRHTLTIILIAVGCSHNTLPEDDIRYVEDYLAEKTLQPSFGGEVISAYEILAVDNSNIYLWVLQIEYYRAGNEIKQGAGWSVPMVLSIERDENKIKTLSHKTPRDGSYYAEDIKTLFPRNTHKKIFDYSSKHIEKLILEVEEEANNRFLE